MKRIVFNTLKICVAAISAILIANLLELEFVISAGIVTILTIQMTKQETIRTALQRCYAFAIGIMIAYVSFLLCGFNLMGFSLYLLIYIFVCQYYKWYASMAMNSVLISHFITFQSMEPSFIWNEGCLFIIGVGIGIFANLHLHKKSDYINALKQQSDAQIQHILRRMAERIMNKVDDYDGTCFDTLNALITKAKAVSMENEKNSLFVKNSFDGRYIKMREQQTQILYEMYKGIRKLNTTPFTAQRIAMFLLKIAEEFDTNNDCTFLLEEFRKIDLQMKSKPLPKERKEFEDRARLFALLRLVEEFLEIKQKFYYTYNQRGIYEYKANEIRK